MSKLFKKNKEDFICEKEDCKKVVKGNGYTNHCPQCLWSKHVDINPGDREATCGAMMKPVDGGSGKNNFYVIQQCIICGHQKRNETSPEDNFDVLTKVIEEKNKKLLSR